MPIATSKMPWYAVRAPKPITTHFASREHGTCELDIYDGGIGRRYMLRSWDGSTLRMLLDLWISDSGRRDDLTRPPYEWGRE